MTRRFSYLFGAALSGALLLAAGIAAAADAPRQAGSVLTDPRAKANQGLVGVATGGVDGTYARIASDLAAVLDSDHLRILPILSKGAMQNLTDLVSVHCVDIGIVQADVLDYARREKLFPGFEKHIQYIAKLYNEELHILAGSDIQSIEDLSGKKVNFDTRGSGGYMTATVVFDALGIKPEPTNYDQALALEKLKQKEISALIYVAGKPARFFKDLSADSGLHFLAVPPKPELLETYLPSRLSKEDYPALITGDAAVPTVAVGAVMAVYNQKADTERYRNLVNFIDAFFSNFQSFLEAPRHPKWKEVNLAAQVPGWTRFAPAENWLKRAVVAGGTPDANQLKSEFESFIDQLSRGGRKAMPAAQKEALFAEFLRWRDAQMQIP